MRRFLPRQKEILSLYLLKLADLNALYFVLAEALGKRSADMIVTTVMVRVKQEHVDDFIRATVKNHEASVKEPGNLRFDVLQSKDDPTRFTLVEVYYDSAGFGQHKETAHYARWRDAVAEMMAEPRVGVKYTNVFPGEDGWK